MDAPKSCAIYVRVTAEDHARLTRLAERQDRKISQVVYRLIRQELREQFGQPVVALTEPDEVAV